MSGNVCVGIGVQGVMKIALAAALALVFVPAAGAKFTVKLTIEPAVPWVKRPARVVVRTSTELPAGHRLSLDVVGGWRPRHGNPFFEARLRRTGPKTFEALVRFPHGGRWRLIVPNWSDSGSTWPPPAQRVVKVQPAP